MAQKIINARAKNKRDTSANWTAANPVLLDGELIIVDTAEGEVRMKIGDGTKKYSQLPFEDEKLRSLLNDKQDKVSISGILKSDGNGNITSATANTDYLPATDPYLKGNPTAPAPTGDTSVANKKYVDEAVSALGFVKGEQLTYSGNSTCYTKQTELPENGNCYIRVGGSDHSDESYEVDASETGIFLRRNSVTSMADKYTQLGLSSKYTKLCYISEGDEYQQTTITMDDSSVEIEAEETINGSATNINQSKITVIPTAIGVRTPSIDFSNVAATTGCPTPTTDTAIANKKYVDDSLSGISAKCFEFGTTAPTNKNLLWIDTTNGSILKYYNGSAWTAVNAVFK